MEKVLNMLYRGEIRPDEENRPMLEELTEVRRNFAERRDRVLDKLDEATREKVEALLEERMEVATYEMEDAYVRGMRMGAKMAVELLGDCSQ